MKMNALKHVFLVVLLAICCCFLSVARAFERQGLLGQYPVCEPSAVVKVTCPASAGDCLLVGDNESDAELFLYPVNAERVGSAAQKSLSLGAVEIGDIEALAKLDESRVLIMGSHSRNSTCETKQKRRRFVQATVLRDKLEPRGQMVESPEIKAKNLFEGVDLTSNNNLAAVGRTIDEAEANAKRAEGNKAACDKANAFNAEGAVAIPDGTSSPRVWIGLRSPVVHLEGKKYAVLLRMAGLDTYQFDGAAFLSLGGRGIRELTLDKDWIWGIAGGPEDGKKNFVLWKIARDAFRPDAVLRPTIVRRLPASSEGLVIVEKTAYVLIDGDRGKGSEHCNVSGQYVRFPLPVQ